MKTLITLILMTLSAPILAQNFERSNDSILSFLGYFEDTIKWREDFRQQTAAVKEYMAENNSKIQSGQYLELQEMAKRYVYFIHQPVREIVESKENFLLFNDFFEIQTLKPTSVTNAFRKQKLKDVNRSTRGEGIRFRTIRVKRYSVNPFDERGQLLLRSFKLQLAAKLTLLDNYIYALSDILDNSYLRRVILWDLTLEHEDVTNILWNTWKSFHHDYQNPRDLYEAYDILRQVETVTRIARNLPGDDRYNQVINQIIEASASWGIAKEKSTTTNFLAETAARMRLMNARQRDDIAYSTDNFVYASSRLFGNFAGSFYLGKGKLYNYSDAQLEAIEEQSKALDVIFDKTGFRLTDSFIPGHFTHAALWSGTEEELKELGVWDELPALYEKAKRNYNYKGPSFQEAIRTKHYIIEALRPGVQINNLRHFIDIDDLVFLRPKTCEDDKRVDDEKGNPKCLTNAMKKRYLIEAFKQIGKDYDFNFDVNTRDRIVCSELIYRTFLDTDFETDKALGRHTIISDQIIPSADEEDDLMYPTLMIINGVEINESVEFKQNILKLLKAEDYEEFERQTGISADY